MASSSAGPQPTKECIQRLNREHRELATNPPANILAVPNPSNLLEFHYVIVGPSDTPYEGGVYHGHLQFKHDYPHSPPAIYMHTPNGRFETDKKLCLSMSDYHPETWSPAWSVSSILVGLLSFMLENEVTAGSIVTSEGEKRQLAEKSLDFNKANELFRQLFPFMCEDDSSSEEEEVADES